MLGTLPFVKILTRLEWFLNLCHPVLKCHKCNGCLNAMFTSNLDFSLKLFSKCLWHSPFVFRSYLLSTMNKCFRVHKYLGSLFGGVLKMSLSFCWSAHPHVTLIKCLKGHKSLGLLCNVKIKSLSQWVSEWVTRSPIELFCYLWFLVCICWFMAVICRFLAVICGSWWLSCTIVSYWAVLDS